MPKSMSALLSAILLTIGLLDQSLSIAAEEPNFLEKEAPYHKFEWHTGEVTVGDGIATINLPEGYRYLMEKDARYVLEKVWNNPADPSVLGLLIPDTQDLEGDNTWVVVVSYEDSGHVNDDDARSIDYDELLKSMIEGTRAENSMRRSKGYPIVNLLGWAEPPHYDSEKKTLYWAKLLQFQGVQDVTLNYNMRLLGRRGVLELNPLGTKEQLSEIKEAVPTLLSATKFNVGNRYEDFDESAGDKVAAYGVAGLIAGGVLAKTGLLKLLIKPLIIIGLIVAAVVGKLFISRRG